VENPLSLDPEINQLLLKLKEKFTITDEQLEQLKHYAFLLQQASKQFNLTTLMSTHDIVYHHFIDSLMPLESFDFKSIRQFADVGSGGGFPGIPLKIANPTIPVVLIEVSSKKADFLRFIAQELALQNVTVEELDWRTFLRKTEYPIDLFVSRASLHTDELMRMFRPSCVYKNAQLIYWASRHWDITPLEKPFFDKEFPYSIENKERKLIFFKSS
jgi:16S rRNA (guanine(527)-N(7))-methyltransferase RsmG